MSPLPKTHQITTEKARHDITESSTQGEHKSETTDQIPQVDSLLAVWTVQMAAIVLDVALLTTSSHRYDIAYLGGDSVFCKP